MKGHLSQFETRVNDVMKSAYKNYKDDVMQAIGYIPSKENDSNSLLKFNDNNLVQDDLQEER